MTRASASWPRGNRLYLVGSVAAFTRAGLPFPVDLCELLLRPGHEGPESPLPAGGSPVLFLLFFLIFIYWVERQREGGRQAERETSIRCPLFVHSPVGSVWALTGIELATFGYQDDLTTGATRLGRLSLDSEVLRCSEVCFSVPGWLVPLTPGGEAPPAPGHMVS